MVPEEIVNATLNEGFEECALRRSSARVRWPARRSVCCSSEEGAITPAAEWFVESFSLVEDVLREIRDDLPPGFFRQLPARAIPPSSAWPPGLSSPTPTAVSIPRPSGSSFGDGRQADEREQT